ESAECLGSRQTRRAAGRRAMLDPWLPGWTQGALRAVPALFLEHLELLQEQGSRQEPARASVEAGLDREDGCGQRRLRSAVVPEAHDTEGLGRGRAAEGHALSLPQSLQPSDAVDRNVAGTSQGCPANLRAGDPDQDVPPLLPGRNDGKDAGLGGRRV